MLMRINTRMEYQLKLDIIKLSAACAAAAASFGICSWAVGECADAVAS